MENLNKHMRIPYCILVLGLMLSMNSCVSYSSLLNYNEPPTILADTTLIKNYRAITIQPNDILSIQVNSLDELAAKPFELGSELANANNPQNLLMNGYLVDQAGNIDFPTLGSIQIGGLSIQEAKEKILTQLEPYFEAQPIVNIRLLNFRISVNGEVGAPGSFDILNERITIIEAITQAGDFTDYSLRDSILIVREADGERQFGYVSFNSAELFTSPYFYLQQNDVVYVRPDRRKLGIVRDPATRIFTWISAVTGIAAFILTLTR